MTALGIALVAACIVFGVAAVCGVAIVVLGWPLLKTREHRRRIVAMLIATVFMGTCLVVGQKLFDDVLHHVRDHDQVRGQHHPAAPDRDHLCSPRSLAMEQTTINAFFKRHGFTNTLSHTEHVHDYRIFVHHFSASQTDIHRMVTILRMANVTKQDMEAIHTRELSNADFQIHCAMGQSYLQDKAVSFHKAEADNTTAQTELKATKSYLYHNTSTGKACLQIYHGSG